MGHTLWALALWLCLALPAAAQSLVPVPPLQARVTDLTNTLTPGQRRTLEQQLAAFEARKGAQLAVLIVPTTRPEEIEQYAIRVVEQWKLGRRNVDDGALLLIAKNDRRLRIEVGYGLEGALTDATTHRIITETITPYLRQGDFYGGVSAGLASMMRVVGGEPLPAPDARWGSGEGTPGRHAPGTGLPAGLIFLVLVGSMILTALFGRIAGSLLTAGAAGLLVATTGHALLLALLVAAGAGLFSLMLGGGRRMWSYPYYGGFGGGFGGGGFRGGGLGGFGGGGGGFGGGGASGRW